MKRKNFDESEPFLLCDGTQAWMWIWEKKEEVDQFSQFFFEFFFELLSILKPESERDDVSISNLSLVEETDSVSRESQEWPQ